MQSFLAVRLALLGCDLVRVVFLNCSEPRRRAILGYPGGVIDLTTACFLYLVLAGWFHQREADAVAYLVKEK